MYVISNRDLRSSRILDLWLEQVDTEETMPLFQTEAKEYILPGLSDVDWSKMPENWQKIVHTKHFSYFAITEDKGETTAIFEWLWRRDQRNLVREIFNFILSNLAALRMEPLCMLSLMVEFVNEASPLAATFVNVDDSTAIGLDVNAKMTEEAPKLLQALILSVEEVQEVTIEPFRQLLDRTNSMSLKDFVGLVKVISLTVRSPDIALDLLLGSLEPACERLLIRVIPIVRQHFVKCLIGLALDHIDEVKDIRSPGEGLFDLRRDEKKGFASARLRIDSKTSTPSQTSDHVRLTTASSPKNSLVQRIYSMDAIVTKVEQGSVTFECCHAIPMYVEDCSWKLTNYGPFVTTQTMFDAVYCFAMNTEGCCHIQEQLLGLSFDGNIESREDLYEEVDRQNLNDSQNAALKAAMSGTVTLLWGPPGTGKSHTIVAILQQLQMMDPNRRILVAAPNHNDIDNVMRKYIKKASDLGDPIRVSTDASRGSHPLLLFS